MQVPPTYLPPSPSLPDGSPSFFSLFPFPTEIPPLPRRLHPPGTDMRSILAVIVLRLTAQTPLDSTKCTLSLGSGILSVKDSHVDLGSLGSRSFRLETRLSPLPWFLMDSQTVCRKTLTIPLLPRSVLMRGCDSVNRGWDFIIRGLALWSDGWRRSVATGLLSPLRYIPQVFSTRRCALLSGSSTGFCRVLADVSCGAKEEGGIQQKATFLQITTHR